ncbi:MAG TPA: retroviral-like aspartic protease family protein [Rhizomicrobium sp.]|nr:retroviral-like aspartic protease family protein [Rhizomicrobium sp.]
MRILFIVAAAALATAPAALADCSPLKLVTSVDLESADDGRVDYVPVQLGGQPAKLVLDTGAANTMIWPDAAARLGLKSHTGHSIVYDVNGGESDQEIITTLSIGRMTGHDIHLAVAPHRLGSYDPGASGLLGPDILQNYDISIDFGTGKLDILSSDHCEGKVVYWPERPIAIIPFDMPDGWHIVLPVSLDGVEVTATLDTGAENSTLLDTIARDKFGIVTGAPDTPKIGNVNGDESTAAYEHKFGTLSLEGLEVRNPAVHIIPDRLSKKIDTRPQIGTHLATKNPVDDEQMLLGMNVLKHLHVYIAYKEKKLFITPAGTPEAGGAPQGKP